ncbi:MAG: LPS export ABC transporter ATP-binding protein [Deltaproteobacteria bacterium]|nr:LPS export ABC transporter ATP-binding protein [Deltaproteobacteria bacterium]
MSKLVLDKLVKSYNKKRAVDNISLSVKKGSVAGLLGPNGAGKTTTFYIAVGLIKPDSGKVFYQEEDITDYPMYIRARKGVGYLPQETSLFKKLTVMENILIVLEASDMTKTKQKDIAVELLEELGIKELADRNAGVLSGGEKRRLEIARTLALSPSFILLDEPFAGIDPLAVSDIKNIIKHLVKKDIGVLVSDHNVRETLEVCDKAYIIHEGKTIISGSPQDIVSSEIARTIYLGDKFRL